MFFREDPRQGGSLIAFQKIERVQTELFRSSILAKSSQFKRLHSKVVRYLGLTFFSQISEDEILKNGKKIVISKKGVHSE